MLFRVKLTLGEYLGFNWKVMAESKGLRNLILILIFIASILPILSGGRHLHGSEKILLFFFSFASILAGAGFVFLSTSLIFYNSRAIYNKENTFTFTEDGVIVESQSSRLQFSWNDMIWAAELSTCFYFRSNSIREGFFIPRSKITSAERDRLVELLKTKMDDKKVRVQN
jgi:hypothetical protein